MTTVLEEPQIRAGNVYSDADTVFDPPPFSGRVYTPGFHTLCSIFPEELRHHMYHAGRRKEYRFPAVPKGQYALLRVYDTWTLTRNLARAAAADPGDDEEGMAMQQSPVHCRAVADDLIRIWAQDAPGNASGAKPGIMVIAGDHPTQLELNQLNEIQSTYFRWLVMKADEYHIGGKGEYITADHRRALRWLGSEDRKWYQKIDTVLLKRCPQCVEEINKLATVCKHCSANLIKFYRDIQVEPTEDEDPGVFQFMQAQKARTAKAEQERQDALRLKAEAKSATDRAAQKAKLDAEAHELVAAAEARQRRLEAKQEELDSVSTESE